MLFSRIVKMLPPVSFVGQRQTDRQSMWSTEVDVSRPDDNQQFAPPPPCRTAAATAERTSSSRQQQQRKGFFTFTFLRRRRSSRYLPLPGNQAAEAANGAFSPLVHFLNDRSSLLRLPTRHGVLLKCAYAGLGYSPCCSPSAFSSPMLLT